MYNMTRGLTCAAYGVQLSVDGESLSVGDPIIFAESQVSFSCCRKPIGINCAVRETVFSDRNASAAHCFRFDPSLQQTAGLCSN